MKSSIFLLALLGLLRAADATTLSGVVRDHGKPVPGALVRITPGEQKAFAVDDGRSIGVARSGEDGAFSLDKVALGKYAVDVEVDGRFVYRDDVVVESGDAQRMDLALDRGAPAVATVTILDADDDSRVELGGTVLSIWSRDHGKPVSFRLRNGRQRLSFYVFNQASFTGGFAPLGGHQPEGWRYKASVDLPGGERIPLEGKEHRPSTDGGRFGRTFVVATIDLDVGTDGSVKVLNTEKDWHKFRP